MAAKYTIHHFRKEFPDDKSCLGFIFDNRWPDGLTCPKCRGKDFYQIDRRKSYACKCGYQVSPTEGTIFHKSSTPLTFWFYAIFLMSKSKNGVSAKELQRQLGVTYKCAWRMAKQIRKLMSDDDGPIDGSEVVEMDETYCGGKRQGKRGRGAAGKTAVFGAVERGGKIKHVSPSHLQTYLDEFSFRYNFRKSSIPLPVLVLARVGRTL